VGPNAGRDSSGRFDLLRLPFLFLDFRALLDCCVSTEPDDSPSAKFFFFARLLDLLEIDLVKFSVPANELFELSYPNL